MRDRVKALVSWVAAALLWLVDRLYGDAIFNWVRPMIPPSIANPSVDALVWFAASFGPAAALVALGIYFFLRASKERPTKGRAKTGDLAADLKAVEGFRKIMDYSHWAREKAANWQDLPAVFYEKDRPESEVVRDRLAQALDRKIHDLLAQGKLQAWGRTGEANVEVLIPSEEWRNIKIDFEPRTLNSRSLDGGAPTTCAWKQGQNVHGQRIAYGQIRFSSAQLYERYPLSKQPRTGAPSDPELVRLRRDISWLAERLGRFDPLGEQHQEVVERYRRVEESDHEIWALNPARQIRRDFLNRCGRAISADRRDYSSRQEREETVREMRDFAEQLEGILSTVGSDHGAR